MLEQRHTEERESLHATIREQTARLSEAEEYHNNMYREYTHSLQTLQAEHEAKIANKDMYHASQIQCFEQQIQDLSEAIRTERLSNKAAQKEDMARNMATREIQNTLQQKLTSLTQMYSRLKRSRNSENVSPVESERDLATGSSLLSIRALTRETKNQHSILSQTILDMEKQVPSTGSGTRGRERLTQPDTGSAPLSGAASRSSQTSNESLHDLDAAFDTNTVTTENYSTKQPDTNKENICTHHVSNNDNTAPHETSYGRYITGNGFDTVALPITNNTPSFFCDQTACVCSILQEWLIICFCACLLVPKSIPPPPPIGSAFIDEKQSKRNFTHSQYSKQFFFLLFRT